MLNKEIRKRTATVYSGDEVAAEIRALAPTDVAQVLVAMSQDIGAVFAALDSIDEIDFRQAAANPEAMADKVMAVLPSALVAVQRHLPDVMAQMIATASGEPDSWEFVRDNFDTALQFNILAEVCRLTFVNVEGFKVFMGNVLALAGVVQNLTSAKKLPGSMLSPDGSEMY